MNMACVSHKGVERVRDLVDTRIGQFVTKCLSGPYDFVVPVESEGMSIFLGESLGDSLPAKIIPDAVLHTLRQETLDGKAILLVDACSFSGEKFIQEKHELATWFKPSSVTTAAFITYADIPKDNKPDLSELHLGLNEYSWAKERLAERRLNQSFPLDGDHLIFLVEVDGLADSEDLVEYIQDIGTSFVIQPSLGSEVTRITIDNIKINRNEAKLPESVWLESVCKVRAFVQQKKPQQKKRTFAFIPIVYPAIPVDAGIRKEECPFVSNLSAFCNNQFAGMTREPKSKACFRCASFQLGMVMARDFVRCLKRHLPSECSLKLAKHPVVLKNLWEFVMDQPDAFLSNAYAFVAEALKEPAQLSQLALEPAVFSFEVLRNDPYLEGLRYPGALSPEMVTSLEVSKWHRELRRKGVGREELDSAGVPFSELCSRLQSLLSPLRISQCFDPLLDEGVLRPRIWTVGKDSQGPLYWVRAYRPGGEHIRRLLTGLVFMQEAVGRNGDLSNFDERFLE